MVKKHYNVERVKDAVKIFGPLDAHSLIIFDVDNVLLSPRDSILQPRGENLVKEWEETFSCLSKEDREEILCAVALQAEIDLVEPETPKIIQDLQRNSIKIIALTATQVGSLGTIQSLEDRRLEQLEKFGFNFSLNFQIKDLYQLKNSQKNNEAAIFKKGVLFSNCHSKGKALRELFLEIKWMPKKLIFIDDQENNILSVRQEMEMIGLHVVSFCYRPSQLFYGKVDKDLARFQVDYLIQYKKWLSDQEAQCLLR